MRLMCSIEAPALEVAAEESAGTNLPLSRNDLILVMRNSDEADGDSKMMGSGRFCFGFIANEVLAVILGAAPVGFFDMKGAASLRTCEKS
jgi:hypothetical protein